MIPKKYYVCKAIHASPPYLAVLRFRPPSNDFLKETLATIYVEHASHLNALDKGSIEDEAHTVL